MTVGINNENVLNIIGEINEDMCEKVCASLWRLQKNELTNCTIFLCTRGGRAELGLFLHDYIKALNINKKIVAGGRVASAGITIFCSVPLEDRLSFLNTRFLLHEPKIKLDGSISDLSNSYQDLLRKKNVVNQLVSSATGQKVEKIESDTSKDFWLDTEEAINYGLLGRVICSSADIWNG